jgi:transcriptional regulator with PAS, ATPase and Fis domain
MNPGDHACSGLTRALNLLRNHGWPGNVRELENMIERLALMLGGMGIVSGADVRSDLEFYGLPVPNNSHESKFISSERT